MKAAKTMIAASQVSADTVSPRQINEAQNLIDRASRLLRTGRHSNDALNEIFRDLYHIIPRRMSDTRKYFLRDGYAETFVMELLQSEQNLLDTFGLDIAVTDKTDRDMIAAKTNFRLGNQRVFRVMRNVP